MKPLVPSNQNGAAFSAIWNKYRPLIISLMQSAEAGPQQYKFFAHEFKAFQPKDESAQFELRIFDGIALTNIHKSMAARDLFKVLNSSKKATELFTQSQFEFSLDKQFIFHVSRKSRSIGEAITS